jgi:hypothetical protein
MYIIVEYYFKLNRSQDKIYAVATHPVQIKALPPRYPVMLY